MLKKKTKTLNAERDMQYFTFILQDNVSNVSLWKLGQTAP